MTALQVMVRFGSEADRRDHTTFDCHRSLIRAWMYKKSTPGRNDRQNDQSRLENCWYVCWYEKNPIPQAA